MYLNIFVRTFAALASAAMLTAQGYDWINGDLRVNVENLGLALVLALIGAATATGWAYAQSPATTALQKATRAALQTILGGIGVVVVNQFADFVDVAAIIVPTLATAALAFGVTFLSYNGQPPVPDPPG